MGILDRIRTVLKANINALISKAEDPEKMLNQLIMDMNEQLLQAKIEEASRKKNLLIARAKRAEAQKQIQQTMGSLSANSSFDTFDRMAQKVDQVEAEAEAMKELGEVTADQKLEDKFKELESSDASSDKLLEDLKSK